MSEKKVLKRAVKEVWDRLKRLRQERAKLYAAGEITASAELLVQCADELKQLAQHLSSLSAMPPADPQAAPAKRRRKSPSKPEKRDTE